MAASSAATTATATSVATWKFEMRKGNVCPTPGSRHEAAHHSPQPRMAAARERPVIREGLGESHRNAGPDRGGQANKKGLPAIARDKGRGEQGGQGWTLSRP